VEEYSMLCLFFLLAIVPAFLEHAVWKLRQSRRPELDVIAPSVSLPPVSTEPVIEPDAPPARVVKWISTSELMRLLIEDSDLLVADLRPDAMWTEFPISTVSALPVTLNDLDLLLEQIPEDRSAVFYGASNVAVFLIATSSCMQGSAPLFLVEGDLRLAEVA
jgi:hypothetical protein